MLFLVQLVNCFRFYPEGALDSKPFGALDHHKKDRRCRDDDLNKCILEGKCGFSESCDFSESSCDFLEFSSFSSSSSDSSSSECEEKEECEKPVCINPYDPIFLRMVSQFKITAAELNKIRVETINDLKSLFIKLVDLIKVDDTKPLYDTLRADLVAAGMSDKQAGDITSRLFSIEENILTSSLRSFDRTTRDQLNKFFRKLECESNVVSAELLFNNISYSVGGIFDSSIFPLLFIGNNISQAQKSFLDSLTLEPAVLSIIETALSNIVSGIITGGLNTAIAAVKQAISSDVSAAETAFIAAQSAVINSLAMLLNSQIAEIRAILGLPIPPVTPPTP